MKTRLFLTLLLLFSPAISLSQVPNRYPVVVVMLENHSYNTVYLSPNMPNLVALTRQYGVAQNFYANGHYSIGNYMFQTFGKVETMKDSYDPDIDGYFSDDNIARHISSLGKTYRMYEENIDAAGSTELRSNDTLYVRRHNPLSYTSDFSNMSQGQRMAVEVPFSQFASDLAAHQLPDLVYITPNLIHDMHDGGGAAGMQTADTWLQTNVFGPLLADPTFQQTGLLIISSDESVHSDCGPASVCPALPEFTAYCSSNCSAGGGHIFTLLVGPNIKPAFKSGTSFMHESTMKSVLKALGSKTYPSPLASVPVFDSFYQALTNPGFELSSTNWHCVGSCSIKNQAGAARTGSRYADLVVTGSGAQSQYFSALANGSVTYYPVKSGQVLTFSGWISRAAGDGVAHLVVELSDSNKLNPIVVTSTPEVISPSKWTSTAGSYTAPAGVAFARFYLELKGSTQPSEVRFDDLNFRIH